MSMKTIRLYGDMGKRFGRVFRLDVATPAEAIKALATVKPGFREYLHERRDQPFRVLRGTEALDEKGLLDPFAQVEVIKIVPVIAGAKDGFGQILLGAALIAITYYTGGTGASFLEASANNWLGAMAINMGTAMVLGGIAGLLAGTPKVNAGGLGTGEAQTWTFGTPTLTVGQGGCVPILYGRMRIGGHVMSAGIDAHFWTPNGFGGMAPDNNGTRGGNGDTAPWVWAKAV